MANSKNPLKVLTLEEQENVRATLTYLEDLVDKFQKGALNLLADYDQGNRVLLNSTISSSAHSLLHYTSQIRAELESKYSHNLAVQPTVNP